MHNVATPSNFQMGSAPPTVSPSQVANATPSSSGWIMGLVASASAIAGSRAAGSEKTGVATTAADLGPTGQSETASTTVATLPSSSATAEASVRVLIVPDTNGATISLRVEPGASFSPPLAHAQPPSSSPLPKDSKDPKDPKEVAPEPGKPVAGGAWQNWVPNPVAWIPGAGYMLGRKQPSASVQPSSAPGAVPPANQHDAGSNPHVDASSQAQRALHTAAATMESGVSGTDAASATITSGSGSSVGAASASVAEAAPTASRPADCIQGIAPPPAFSCLVDSSQQACANDLANDGANDLATDRTSAGQDPAGHCPAAGDSPDAATRGSPMAGDDAVTGGGSMSCGSRLVGGGGEGRGEGPGNAMRVPSCTPASESVRGDAPQSAAVASTAPANSIAGSSSSGGSALASGSPAASLAAAAGGGAGSREGAAGMPSGGAASSSSGNSGGHSLATPPPDLDDVIGELEEMRHILSLPGAEELWEVHLPACGLADGCRGDDGGSSGVWGGTGVVGPAAVAKPDLWP
eukprot:jgi/Mesvir1/26432/Mv16120-RA.1